MKPIIFRYCTAAAFFFISLGAPAEEPMPPQNLLPEGTFEVLNDKGEPLAWTIPHPSYQQSIGAKFELVTEGEAKFARMTASQADKSIHIAAVIPLPENSTKVTVSYRTRCRDIIPAQTPEWASVRLGGGFAGEDGKDLGYLRISKSQRSATPDWVTVTDTFSVPAGAKTLLVQPGIYFCTGSADFDDLTVTVESTPAPATPSPQP
jgi:hypothetical protein